jgi:hypothetical protein
MPLAGAALLNCSVPAAVNPLETVAGLNPNEEKIGRAGCVPPKFPRLLVGPSPRASHCPRRRSIGFELRRDAAVRPSRCCRRWDRAGRRLLHRPGLRALEVCITVPRLESHTVVIRISGGKEPARNSGTPFSGRPRERHSLDPETEIAMQIHGVVFRNHEESAG